MTGLKPYPEYKDSGVEWAPRLPVSWSAITLNRAAVIFAGGTPDRDNPNFWECGTVPWLNSGSVNNINITAPSELITEVASTGGNTRWAHPGSVLVALAGQGKTKGMAARLAISSTFNQSMAAIVPRKDLFDYRFLQFWLSSNYVSIRNLAGGDLRDGLNLKHIGGIQAPMPPVGDQRRISDFLDRETAEIDAFIADQEELIGLLIERRAATISQAVTKGLDPSIPTKDSGVEWLGEVPVHWAVTRVKHIADILAGFAFGSDDFADGDAAVRLLRGINIGVGKLDWTSTVGWNLPIDERFLPYLIEHGDVLVGLDRPIISTGVRVAIVTVQDVPALLVQRVARLRGIRGNSNRFIGWTMSARMFGQYLEPIFTGVSVPHISPQQVGDFSIAIPGGVEQASIANYLDHEISELDAAIDDAREAISLSTERRAALISAAVTGKIDVRDAA